MIAGFFVHLVAYVAVSATMLVIWAIGATGSFAQLGDYAREPDTIEATFWPVWVIVPWGAAVLIHFAATIAFGVFGGRRRRHRRSARHEMREHARRAAEIGIDAAGAALSGLSERVRRGGDVAPRKAAGPERRWVTVMFTDIVNSTQLTETLGDEEWSRLLRRHREMVRRAFTARGGKEVGTQGDGFLARFESPAEAVLCAVDIQRAEQPGAGGGAPLPRVRIGIHAGEAVEDDGDLVGRVVNLASRVAATAGPGEILVTEPVADYVGGRITLEDRGVRELKGIPQPRHLLSVVWEDEGAPEPAGT